MKRSNAKVLQMAKLDDYDRKIIAALQANGRLSNIHVAERVNLSHSSCSHRIARLEREGVIVGGGMCAHGPAETRAIRSCVLRRDS